MAHFVLICHDKPASRDLRLATREAHLAYAQAKGCVKAGGPFLDADGQPIGSMLIVETDSLAEAKRFAAHDPYALAGLFASVDVRPWRLALGGFV
jgi:uncharacterized protein YciI